MQSLRILIWIILLVTIRQLTMAQTYPVQVSTALIPPYSPYLSDYTTSDRLFVNVLFNDPVTADLAIKFKLTIEGQGITIVTKPEYNPAPVYLQSGFPERFTGRDLAAYFDPQNLNFLGLDRNQLVKTSALPNGVYRISIEVWEYTKNRKVSNSGSAIAWMILNDPPIINLPFNGQKVRIIDPQLVTFNWTPRHTGSPNSAFQTEYEFEMVEVRPNGRNPNDAMLSSPRIFNATTMSTSLIYGMAETPLIPGQQYAFRVRAKAIAGVEELDLFKNNGYSEVYTFTYGDFCRPPESVTLLSDYPSTIKGSWSVLPGHTSFLVRYKKDEPSATQWYEESTLMDSYTISGLQPGTAYVIQIVGTCGSQHNTEIESYKVTTKALTTSDFACGTDGGTVSPDKNTLKSSLKAFDIIESDNFKIVLSEVNGGNGVFSGKGVAYIPWFKAAGFKVEFKNIKVNERSQVFEGHITSVSGKGWVKVIDASPNPTTGNPVEQNSTSPGSTHSPSEPSADTSPNITPILIPGTISSVVKDGNGDIVVTSTNGQTQTFENGEQVIKDESGNTYNVDQQGSITHTNGNATGEEVTTGGAVPSDGNSNGTANNIQTEGNSSVERDAPMEGAFGPLVVQYEATPVETSENNGQCTFSAKGTFDIPMKGNELQEKIHVNEANVSFIMDCETGKLIEANFSYQNDAGKEVGKIGYLGAKLNKLSLKMDKDKNISGSADMNVYLNDDLRLSQIPDYDKLNTSFDITIYKGVNGGVSFGFVKSTEFSGDWDFSGIRDLHISFTRDNMELGRITNGRLSKTGVFTGTLKSEYPLEYASAYGSVAMKEVKVDIKLPMKAGFKDFEITGGSAKVSITDLQNVKGKLNATLSYSVNGFKGELKSEGEIKAFGMDLSKLNLVARFDQYLALESVTGSFMAKHDRFSTEIEVVDFAFDKHGLQTFNMKGKAEFNQQILKIQQAVYEPKNDLLNIDAVYITGKSGEEKFLNITGFKIHSDGTIESGDVSGAVDSGEMFGPLRMVFEIPPSTKTDSDGYKIYENIKGSFFITLAGPKETVKELAIKDAIISYKKHPETGHYKDVRVSWKGELNAGKIGWVGGTIREMKLLIDGEGNLSGNVKLDAYLTDDVMLSNHYPIENGLDLDLIIRKGITGSFTFNFAGKKSFEGNWDLNGIKQINGDLLKAEKRIASLEDGKIDDKNLLSGLIHAYPGATYKTKYATIAVEELDMGISVSLTDGMKSFRPTYGRGLIHISEMENVQGKLSLELSYLPGNNFQATVKQENETTLSAFKMNLSNLNLHAVVDTKFNLKEVSGSVTARHTKFEGGINISKFLIQDGRLITFNGRGDVLYKGFAFEISEIDYQNSDRLSASANVTIDLGGKAPQKVAVDKFLIDKNGDVSIGKIAGSFNKDNLMSVEFEAAFEESRFKGSFKGELGLIALTGEMDLGTATTTAHQSYNFGYLQVTTTVGAAGIPLGATGLKLTKLGGQLGINYRLTEGKGDPEQGNTVIGLTLGLSDLANLCEVTGNPIVQFGKNGLQFDLKGSLKIPRTVKPIVDGTLEVTYRSPQESLDGNLSGTIKLPPANGYVFTSDLNAAFSVARQQWSVQGTNTGKIFNSVDFSGSMSLGSTIRDGSSTFEGYLVGSISYTKKLTYQKNFKIIGFEANMNTELDVSFASSGRYELNDEGFSTQMMVDLNGQGRFHLTGTVNYDLVVSGTSKLNIAYANDEAKIKGELELVVQSDSDKGDKYNVEVELVL